MKHLHVSIPDTSARSHLKVTLVPQAPSRSNTTSPECSSKHSRMFPIKFHRPLNTNAYGLANKIANALSKGLSNRYLRTLDALNRPLYTTTLITHSRTVGMSITRLATCSVMSTTFKAIIIAPDHACAGILALPACLPCAEALPALLEACPLPQNHMLIPFL